METVLKTGMYPPARVFRLRRLHNMVMNRLANSRLGNTHFCEERVFGTEKREQEFAFLFTISGTKLSRDGYVFTEKLQIYLYSKESITFLQ